MQKFPTKATLEVKFNRIIIFLEPRQICFMWGACLKIFADRDQEIKVYLKVCKENWTVELKP